MFAGWGVELVTLLTNRSSERLPAHRFSQIAPAGMLLTLFTGLGLMAWLGAAEGWMLVAIAGIILTIAFGVYSERCAVAREAVGSAWGSVHAHRNRSFNPDTDGAQDGPYQLGSIAAHRCHAGIGVHHIAARQVGVTSRLYQ